MIGPGGSRAAIPHRSGTLTAASSAADLVGGVTADFAGSAVVDTSSGRVLWRNRGWTLTTFSASGRYVAGRQSAGYSRRPNVGDSSGSGTPPPATR